jgi:hypothetical protein
MASRKSVSVKFTANFETNLAEIEAYWALNQFPQGYDRLLDELSASVIPSIERFPGMGRPFVQRQPDTIEAITRLENLNKRLAKLDRTGDFREYVMEDYLILYLTLESAAYLFAIKHHKQLSFDFERLGLPG